MPATLEAVHCLSCGERLSEQGQCLSADCERGAQAATRAAGRDTAKVAVGNAVAASPRAFTSSGRVD